MFSRFEELEDEEEGEEEEDKWGHGFHSRHLGFCIHSPKFAPNGSKNGAFLKM